MMLESRTLVRAEIKDLWQIDRSERVEAVYCLVDGGLVLRPEHHDVEGWPRGQPEPDDRHLEYDLWQYRE